MTVNLYNLSRKYILVSKLKKKSSLQLIYRLRSMQIQEVCLGKSGHNSWQPLRNFSVLPVWIMACASYLTLFNSRRFCVNFKVIKSVIVVYGVNLHSFKCDKIKEDNILFQEHL